MKTVFMEKGDVTLRPAEIEDAEFFQELITHKQVRPYIGRRPEPLSLEKEKQYLREQKDNKSRVQFMIEYKGEKAGDISLGKLDSDYRKSEVGFTIHPDFQNKGIATTALKLVSKYAFETLNRHKIRGGHLEGNKASKKVMEKAGFQKEGQERHYKYVDGEWKDVIWMSILKNEYQNRG